LIRPVLEDPRGFLFLSIRAMAERLQTDTATTLRSIRGMGFVGYPEFRRYLHDLTIAHATSLDSMLASTARDSDIPSHVRDSLDQDQKNFTSFRNTLDTKQLARLAQRMWSARRIILLGWRSSVGPGLLSRTSSGDLGLACVLQPRAPAA
jgi:DNA-binding MurR/RpiR family transcriptional regulator